LNRGDVFEAYHLYLQAGLHNAAHDLAVFELAPEAVIRNDLELLKVLFERFVGHVVEEWHVRGKVSKIGRDYSAT
jgi:nuclear pore complex protein Nup98-Nup96